MYFKYVFTNYKSILYFLSEVKGRLFDRSSISNTIFKSILYFVFNTLPKIIFYNCGNSDRRVGNMPVWITGMLVLKVCFCDICMMTMIMRC